MRSNTHANLFWFFLALLVIAGALLWPGISVRGQEAGDFPNCAGWIPHQCSCTSRSCYEARPGEVIDLGNGTFRVVATGEIVKRTAWSKDGRFVLCAFKQSTEQYRWITGPGNPIRCIFPPPPSS